MSAVAAAIAVMRAKGLDPADILDVVEAIAGAAPVRSAGAERQARYRQRQSVTSDVTRDVTPPSLKDVEPNLVTVQVNQNPPPYSPPAQKNSRGNRISADWQPSERNIADAVALGMPSSAIEPVSRRFRDFWTAKAGKDAVKLDWDATWRNWCSSEAERKGWAPSSPSPSGSPPEGVFVAAGTAEWDAWTEHRGKKLWFTYCKINRAEGRYFPSRFPPEPSLTSGRAA